MTVSEAIINWLKTFDNRRMKRIDTDMQSPEELSYSLVKEPIQNVKTYISGLQIFTEHYTLQARLPSQYDSDRIDNHSFGEALEEWVRDQNHAQNFPELENARVVKEIGITTPFFVGATAENHSVYQMTIAIKYVKENRQ